MYFYFCISTAYKIFNENIISCTKSKMDSYLKKHDGIVINNSIVITSIRNQDSVELTRHGSGTNYERKGKRVF